MADAGLTELSLYPEDRGAGVPRPPPSRLLEIVVSAARNHFAMPYGTVLALSTTSSSASNTKTSKYSDTPTNVYRP